MAAALRRLAASGKNANQTRLLLSLAAVLDSMARTEAARIIVRQWVRRGTRPRGRPTLRECEPICAARGTGAAPALPFADTDAM